MNLFLMTSAYDWDGTFNPDDFGEALKWIKKISNNTWNTLVDDFFIYFIICLFVLPPVIYIIGCFIIDMVNYRPSLNRVKYDNGRSLYRSNITGWTSKINRYKTKKKDIEPPYEVIKETVTDELGNKKINKYKNNEYLGSVTYVTNEKPYVKVTETWYDSHHNRGSRDYVNGKFVGSRRVVSHKTDDVDNLNINNENHPELDIEYDDDE